MKWINPALSVVAIILSGYFGYVTSQLSAAANEKTEEHNKKQDIVEVATLSEQMKQVRLDIKNMNNLAKELEEKIYSFDKHIAIIEERLKNSTTKSLMAAGASKEQALQFWKNPLSSLPKNFLIKEHYLQKDN